MTRQVKSKQRVAEHGEVFTSEREVNAMLDLVNKKQSVLTVVSLNLHAEMGTSWLKFFEGK